MAIPDCRSDGIRVFEESRPMEWDNMYELSYSLCAYSAYIFHFTWKIKFPAKPPGERRKRSSGGDRGPRAGYINTIMNSGKWGMRKCYSKKRCSLGKEGKKGKERARKIIFRLVLPLV